MRNVARAFVVGADMTRSVGPAAAARIMAQDMRRRKQGEGPRDAVYERLWRQAATAVDAAVTPLGGGVLEIRRGGSLTRVMHQYVDLDGVVTMRVSRDKALSLRLLSQAGLPVPEHVEVHPGDTDSARALLERVGTVVVKPASGTGGGFGVSAQVASPHDLDRALRRVGRTQRRIVVEQQVPGIVHRVLLLEGRLLDVLRRHPPRVAGDGARSIFDLMLAENDRRIAAYGDAGIDLLRVDLDCLTTLRKLGVGLDHVPAAGEMQTVKTVNNQNCASDNEPLRAQLSGELLEQCVAAARVAGVRLAGVDVITTDPTRPLTETGGAIIEVNAAPGLHHHQHVADRSAATPVAIPVLERLLAAGPSVD